MRWIFSLLIISISSVSWGTINFVEITPLDIDEVENTIRFKFQEKGKAEATTLYISRRIGCLSSGNTLGRGTIEEYEQAKDLLRSYIKQGHPFEFGLNALAVPGKENYLWAVNLRIFGHNRESPIVWSINSDVGGNSCAYNGS